MNRIADNEVYGDGDSTNNYANQLLTGPTKLLSVSDDSEVRKLRACFCLSVVSSSNHVCQTPVSFVADASLVVIADQQSSLIVLSLQLDTIANVFRTWI